jgi:RNA polymerase sigma factor (sigma-70 family)
VLNLEPYVRKVLLNLFVDRARRRGRWRRLVPLLATPTHQDAHEHSDLADALSRLPARQRACVVLHYYADLPVSEISEQLGISTGTAKRHLHDARGRLSDQLGPSISVTSSTRPKEDGHAAAR